MLPVSRQRDSKIIYGLAAPVFRPVAPVIAVEV